jgi:hydroxymethylpyrimidine/phosphomethylpyrimidine kinase
MACALAIGGLDPGGGAGVAADLRAFAAADAFGCAAVAVMTVQSTAGLRRARPTPASELAAIVWEVMRHQHVRAIKVGALGSAANVRAVARVLAARHEVPAVVDVPMRATRAHGGARLLAASALGAVREELVPRATLLTVNAEEAAALLGVRVKNVRDAHNAARGLVTMGARAALVKGGHLEGTRATDVLSTRASTVELRARRIEGARVHGTGCTLASLIAGRLAHAPRSVDDATLLDAVRWGKRIHHAALERARDVGGGARVLVF